MTSWVRKARVRALDRLRQATAERDLENARTTLMESPPTSANAMHLAPVEEAPPSVDDGVPRGLRVAAAWAWRLIVLAGGGYVLVTMVSALTVVIVPVAVALLLSALLYRPVSWLKRHGWPASLSAAVVLVSGLALVGGTLTIVIRAFVSGFGDLSENVDQGLDRVKDWLVDGPLHLSQEQLNNAMDSAQNAISDNKDILTAGALSTANTVTHLLAGFFVVLFTTFFFLRDGAKIWAFMTRVFLPRRARQPVWRAGNQAWITLFSYVRATVFVAFVDALGIGMGVFLLGVPLALPLGAFVFLGSFIPVIGATLTGAVAVLVALVAKGPVTALLVLAVVIAVQQLEGHVLQPLVMGRAVALHPLSVILALTTGAVLAGIVGALVAVPLLAVLNTAVRALATEEGRRLATPLPEVQPPAPAP